LIDRFVYRVCDLPEVGIHVDMQARTKLVDWLSDCYAMEQGVERFLQRQLSLDETGEENLRTYVEQTKLQGDRVRSCLESLGEEPAPANGATSDALRDLEVLMARSTSDAPMRALVLDYAVKHMEIASYRCVIEAAVAAGEREIVDTCHSIIAEEEGAIAWIDKALPAAASAALGEDL
jgi:ferritin-like metal-binding protein YciE